MTNADHHGSKLWNGSEMLFNTDQCWPILLNTDTMCGTLMFAKALPCLGRSSMEIQHILWSILIGIWHWSRESCTLSVSYWLNWTSEMNEMSNSRLHYNWKVHCLRMFRPSDWRGLISSTASIFAKNRNCGAMEIEKVVWLWNLRWNLQFTD